MAAWRQPRPHPCAERSLSDGLRKVLNVTNPVVSAGESPLSCEQKKLVTCKAETLLAGSESDGEVQRCTLPHPWSPPDPEPWGLARMDPRDGLLGTEIETVQIALGASPPLGPSKQSCPFPVFVFLNFFILVGC